MYYRKYALHSTKVHISESQSEKVDTQTWSINIRFRLRVWSSDSKALVSRRMSIQNCAPATRVLFTKALGIDKQLASRWRWSHIGHMARNMHIKISAFFVTFRERIDALLEFEYSSRETTPIDITQSVFDTERRGGEYLRCLLPESFRNFNNDAMYIAERCTYIQDDHK